MDTFKILGLSKENRDKQIEKLQEEVEYRKLYKPSHSYLQDFLR